MLLDGQEGVVDGGIVGDVELDGVDVAGRAEGRDGGFAFVHVAAGHEDLVLRVGGEGFDDFVADAGVGACHQDNGAGLGGGAGGAGEELGAGHGGCVWLLYCMVECEVELWR